MRYQTFAVIFIAIILPISMVLSFYIQMQSDIIALESKYESKLNNATYAAVSAYQMNSLNTQRVAGESILNYVEASVNTFHTTLATSMLQSNASKNLFRPYIPAILFTTYDGYYIYSPYKAAVAAVIQVNEPISGTNTLPADNGQTILSSDKEVVYINKDSNIDYKVSNKDTINRLRETKSNLIDKDFTTDITQAKMDYSYKLKPFIYYSCRYQNDSGTKDFVASYSLDNYLTVYGKNGANTFSKAGYGINPGDVDIKGKFLVKLGQRDSSGVSLGSYLTYNNSGSINIDSIEQYYNDISSGGSSSAMKFLQVDWKDIKDYIDDYSYNSEKGKKEGNNYYYAQVSNNEHDLSASDTTKLTRYQTGDNIIEDTINLQEVFGKHKSNGPEPEKNDVWQDNLITVDGTNFTNITVTYKGLEITDPDAKKYYIKARFFSEWVSKNLGDIKEKNAKENQGIVDVMNDNHDNGFYDDLRNSNNTIFDFSANNDPSSELSPFFLHKTSIIKNSIQQNLNAAISNFNEDRKVSVDAEYTYMMPVLNSSDWDNILNNVCMVSFMQGIPTGNNRKFNSYAIVKSTNNNTFATPDSLYFTEEIGVDEEKGDYHKLDCVKLGNLNDSNQELVGDRSAEFKYDALKVNSLVLPNVDDDEKNIIAFEDDTTHTFYEAVNKGTASDPEWTIGKKITNPSNYNGYNLNNNNDVVTGTLIKYLFDHQNMGCYDCIISGNHDSCVKYYDGDLHLTGKTSDTGEIIIYYKGTTWIYPDGNPYSGATPQIVLEQNDCRAVNGELQKRRQALFNMLGKYKETQYKSNDYINR